MIIAPDIVLDEVLRRWPQTLPVFLRHGMACVGCSMAAVETLGDAIRTHGMDVDPFLAELHAALDGGSLGNEARC